MSLEEARKQYLPSGKRFGDATLEDWSEALAIHRTEGEAIKQLYPGYVKAGARIRSWEVADETYKRCIRLLNLDRQTKGLPLIEF